MRGVLIFLIILFFEGCSVKEVQKPIISYDLIVPKVDKVKKIGDKIIKIGDFRALDSLMLDNILYQNGVEIEPYAYSKWRDDFVKLIQREVGNVLEESGLFRAVVNGGALTKYDYLLEGEVVEAKQIIKENRVHFLIKLYIVDAKSGVLVLQKRFYYKKGCREISAKGAVLAYNDIMKNFSKDVIKWIERLIKKS